MPVMQRRAQDTRSALLQSARQVFADVGYSEANVAEVVARAGSSVGSMYHHFGGKADLFLALHDGYQTRQEARADDAVRDVLAAGEPQLKKAVEKRYGKPLDSVCEAWRPFRTWVSVLIRAHA